MSCDIDLSFLIGKNTVINCETEQEANDLMDALDKQFAGVAFDGKNMWYRYEESTCYRINKPELGYRMYYDHYQFYEDDHEIIPFSSIAIKPDFGEIDNGCFSVESMLGGELM